MARAKEFETVADVQEKQADYHFLLLTIGPNKLADGTVTGNEADVQVKQWLDAGYSILSVDYLGRHQGAGGQGELFGYQFGYHLVKNAA